MARIKDVREIPLTDLHLSTGQVRTSQVDKELDELADSIRKVGLLEPIVVYETEDGEFEVITGQRRFLAHHRIGATHIMAGILDTKVSEHEAKVLSVTENLVRRDLNSKDLIDVCTYLYKHYGSIQNVADETGLSAKKVSQYVKYDQLIPELQKVVNERNVPLATALRAQQAASAGGPVNSDDAVKFALEMAGMSGAQQRKIVSDRQKSPDAVADDIIENAKRGGRITQIVVTLTSEAHAALSQYAQTSSLSALK
jgi:ParB family chromosome partitioning protein